MQAEKDGEAASEWEASLGCAENCHDGVGIKAVTTVQITQLGGVTVWRKILFSFGIKGESC